MYAIYVYILFYDSFPKFKQGFFYDFVKHKDPNI